MLTDPGYGLATENAQWLARRAVWAVVHTPEQEAAEVVQSLKDFLQSMPVARQLRILQKIRVKVGDPDLTKADAIQWAITWLQNRQLKEDTPWL